MADDAAASPVRRLTLDLRVRRLQVVDVVDLGRGLRRVTLGGPEAEGFTCSGPSDHAKVLFPADDGRLVLPDVADRRLVDGPDIAYVARDYTIRTHRPGDGTITLDMAVHGHGPAGRWAAAAAAGQELGLFGPKTTKLPPLDRAWYLLAADETGLPAVTNWLERLAASPVPGRRVHAFVEVDGPQDELDLPADDGVVVTWVHRDGASAGTTTALADAVASAAWGAPDGAAPGWVFAGAEATSVRALRRVVADRGVDRASLSMTGYWRLGVANFDHKSAEAQA